MRPEYAPNGLIGLLTPQANTTVEPEFSVLMPDGIAWLNARMTSDHASISARLIDYMDRLNVHAHQFGNAPIQSVALACTGTAYFVGADREDQMLHDLSKSIGVPVFSAATAVVDALAELNATRVVLVSPYDGDVDAACVPYWEQRGLQIARKLMATGDSGFHPIYSLASQDADQALGGLVTDQVDAIVILGTGMPTLATLARLHSRFEIPVLSCMLCLGWRAASLLDATQLGPDRVRFWASGADWAHRLSRFTP